MEEIILNLLVTDTAVIHQATAQLKEAFKNPQSTQLLYQLIVNSKTVQVRQYAALLLRKRYNKIKCWSQLSQEIRSEFKAVLLQALVQETEKSVKNAIAQLIGVIIKHELPQNGWPECLQYIRQLITSGNPTNQELGMYTLSIMTEIAPNTYLHHVQTVMELLNNTLNTFTELANPVSCYILDTMLNLVPLIGGNQIIVNAYHHMIPRIMQIIQALTLVNERKAIKGFELLDELCECAPTVISPHIKSLIEMCLFIANSKSLHDDLKIKAVSFIGWLAKIKKKAIVKHKLVEPIIDMLFTQMCTQPDDENQEIYFTGKNDNSPITSATQTLDLLALHLPPEKLLPHLLKHIQLGLEDTNVCAKKASYLSMAVLAEGCSEYIRNKYLETFLKCICEGITNSAPVVRNAALFALGQFSEHLQPEISRYADELLPILFQYLSQISAQIRLEKIDLASVDRMFYALEIFAENLNEGLLPYLPTLMIILFDILLDNNSPVHICELTLSAIGAAANASKEHMLPYFKQIVDILLRYLIVEKQTIENMCLLIQAVDTLGVLARTIGEENFAPLAMKSLEIGMSLLEDTDDPDLKKSVYGLLASISLVIKKEMSLVLPIIVEYMITSIQSSEGIVTRFKDDENSDYLVYEDLSDSENDEEDIENTDNEDEDDDNDEDFAGYSVENAYVEEKEEAILALREIAEHTKEAFIPYLERSFEEVFKLINYPLEDIRKATVDALMQFCINFSKIETHEGKQATQKALTVFMPKLSELIRLDEERSVVMQALDACSELLEQLKSNMLVGTGHKEAIMNCITDVMLGRTECQDPDGLGTEGDGDEGEAEHDELLFECAGQLLTNLGKVISSEDFALYLQTIFPILIKRLRNNFSEAQRSFSIGTILECLPALKQQVSAFVTELFPIFVKFTNDTCNEVRSNAIFGLGELAFYGKETVYPHYLQILQVLSTAIAKEAHGGARDNIIGAIARLIITNHTIIPLEQVFPVFVNHLPLKDDLEENKTVFKSVLVLYRNGNTILKPHINRLLKISLDVFENTNIDDETKQVIAVFIRLVQMDFPNEWNSFYGQLSAESCTHVQRIFM
ncbi:PREDICTED: importin-4-like [Ceratosolen solmsi marchali]|uniref:Importin-4-like n=1 Tax=Ceratosolen solmsi marchali TaxID=326594 RepID=A0AAJ7DYV0_9HYME|nr:PREDICTED: importin-4-like [Ceratosolen solmsi marchali]